jgi:hypothetical protein
VHTTIPATYSAVNFSVPVHGVVPQVGSYTTGLPDVPAAMELGFVLALLIIGIVLVPAVWSRQAERRKAAAEVLDRIIQLVERIIKASRPRRR